MLPKISSQVGELPTGDKTSKPAQQTETGVFGDLLGGVVAQNLIRRRSVGHSEQRIIDANHEAHRRQRIANDDLRVADEALNKRSHHPAHQRMGAVDVARARQGFGPLSSLFRPSTAQLAGMHSSQSPGDVPVSQTHGAGDNLAPRFMDTNSPEAPTTVRQPDNSQNTPDKSRRLVNTVAHESHHTSNARVDMATKAQPNKNSATAPLPSSVQKGETFGQRSNVAQLARVLQPPTIMRPAPHSHQVPQQTHQHNSRFPSGASGAPKSQASSSLPEHDKPHTTIKDVLRVLRSGLSENRSKMTMQLSPPELGQLRIDLDLQKSSLGLIIRVESMATKSLLDSNSDVLHQALSEQGLRLDKYVIYIDEPEQVANENQQENDRTLDEDLSDPMPREHHGHNESDSSDYNNDALPDGSMTEGSTITQIDIRA